MPCFIFQINWMNESINAEIVINAVCEPWQWSVKAFCHSRTFTREIYNEWELKFSNLWSVHLFWQKVLLTWRETLPFAAWLSEGEMGCAVKAVYECFKNCQLAEEFSCTLSQDNGSWCGWKVRQLYRDKVYAHQCSVVKTSPACVHMMLFYK